jgi:hypothetical protein
LISDICSIDGRFLVPLCGLVRGKDLHVQGGHPMSVTETLGYRSPLSKLLRFFRLSRDRWKSKCKAAKRENKSLKIRLGKMTESRDRWKAKAQSVEGYSEADPQPLRAEAKNRGQWTFRGPRAGIAA